LGGKTIGGVVDLKCPAKFEAAARHSEHDGNK
jgi:hypothetical protein